MEITDTPTNILANQPAAGEWLVQNLGINAIFLSRTEEGCTATAGVKVAINQAISIDEPARKITETAELWACTASGTADVRVIRVG